jgi:hypothetical protein
MAKVGQISIARPGFPLQLKFDESDLKATLEGEAQPGDHVTLYPGDFSTWYQKANLSEDTQIKIREGISVTILPGARVSYTDDFRKRNFAHDGETFDSFDGSENPNHPLNTESNSFPAQEDETLSSKRYAVPNFTGHVENIVDFNFGSEWAFESDLESLQEQVDNAIGRGRNSIGVTTNTQQDAPPLQLGDKLEFVEKDSVNINTEAIPEEEPGEGVRVNIGFDKTSISSLEAGRNLEADQSTGEVRLDHSLVEDIPTDPEVTQDPDGEKFSGSTVLQNLFLKNGHISDYEAKEYATIQEREPRTNDGEQGDIWFVKDRDFLLNLYYSSSKPTQFDGQDGDIWVVGSEFRSEFRKAGNFLISQSDPTTDQGEDGYVWLDVPLESGSFAEDPLDIGQIDQIIYQTFTPTKGDGKNKDVRATTTRKV